MSGMGPGVTEAPRPRLSAPPGTERSTGLWDRLSILEQGPTALVMDRGNGKWALVPASTVRLVRLLLVDEAALPEPVRVQRQSVAEELAALGLGGPAFQASGDLRTLILKLTNACNYACTYCYDFEAAEGRLRMELETAVAAVEQALDIAPTSLQVIFHGGEPTLVFSLLRDIVLRTEPLAARLGKRLVFTGQTNLSRLTREMVDFSREHRIGWGISLDGPPALNDQLRVLRDGGGTYSRFQGALEEFPDFVRGCPVLSTITSVTDAWLLPIARHFRDLGCAGWGWSLFQPVGRGREFARHLDLSVDRLIASWNELFDAVEDGEFDGFPVRPILEYVDNFVDGPRGSMCKRKDCGAGRDLMSISADGAIEACDCIDRTGPLAGLGRLDPLRSDSLREARQGEKAEMIRSRDVERGKCASCIWLSVCGGTCLAYAPSLHGVWEAECAVAMNAFERVAASMAASDRLRAYRRSCQHRVS